MTEKLKGRKKYMREYRLKRDHDMTLEEYEALVIRQKGVCAICGSPPDDSRYGLLHVDHHHDTDSTRGLLCDLCNRGLGFFRDSPDLLQKAKEYLEYHETKKP